MDEKENQAQQGTAAAQAAAGPSPVELAFQTRFPDAQVSALPDRAYQVVVRLDDYVEAARFARDELAYTHLSSLTCTDHLPKGDADAGQIKLVVHLARVDASVTQADPDVALKVEGLPREGAVVPSLTDLWPTSNWHEREAFDMFGVEFAGHPNLRRILLPDNWQGGFPLLKDFEDQRPRRPRLIRYR